MYDLPTITIIRDSEGNIKVLSDGIENVDVNFIDYELDPECFFEGDETPDGKIIKKDDDGNLFAFWTETIGDDEEE